MRNCDPLSVCLLLGALSALFGCAASRAPEAPGPEAAPRPEPSAPPQEAPREGAATKAAFQEELAEIQRLRGLRADRPVQGLRVNRDDLRAHLQQTFDSNVPLPEQTGTEEMLIALGDLPQTFHFKEAWLSLMQSELAGLYDPQANALFVVDGLGSTLDRATLFHELVHAVQDQNFDLDRLTEPGEDRGDERSAISSLAEGDATSAMFDSILRSENKTALDIPAGIIETQLTLSGEASAKSVPPLIVRSMIAPYIDGIAFVHALRARGGFTEVDRVWRNLPRSTEQILHLDKYDANEAPAVVPLPKPPSPDFEVVFHDVWGEQSLRLLLEEWVDHKTAERAAAGWGGDRIVTFSRGAERAVAAVWVMDTTQDAGELVRAFQARRSGAKPEDSFCLLGKNQLPFALARVGSKVVAAVGPYTRGTDAVGSCQASLSWARLMAR